MFDKSFFAFFAGSDWDDLHDLLELTFMTSGSDLLEFAPLEFAEFGLLEAAEL